MTIVTVLVLIMYLPVALVYARFQRRFADLRSRITTLPTTKPYLPSIDVIVPCYNEDPSLLAACLRSLREQDYDGEMNVWVVDDGSHNREALLPVLAVQSPGAWRVLLVNSNRGKREAQDRAFRQSCGEIVVTVDSDTTLARDGIRRIVAPLRDGRVGAVTGNLRASNADVTWLSRLIDTRYRLLFERERAAQSFFGAVLCCAGPFSAYRRATLKLVWSGYVGQEFWGHRRVIGDDLALTNLVLAAGYHSEYEPRAQASTNVPETLCRFLRQQLRWHRSFCRELPQMIRLLPGRNCFLALDLIARTLLPALLIVGVTATAADAVLESRRLPVDGAALALMAVASLGLGPSLATATGRRFVLGYGLLFVGLLLLTRLWAACTLFQNSWVTRNLPESRVQAGEEPKSMALRDPIAVPVAMGRRDTT
jgi:N-acetylglucosaminyltransferase